MEAYCAKVKKLEAKFDGLELCHILEGTTRRLIASPASAQPETCPQGACSSMSS
jgi:hypothetical protein